MPTELCKFMGQSMRCGLTSSGNVGFVHNLFTHSKTVIGHCRGIDIWEEIGYLMYCPFEARGFPGGRTVPVARRYAHSFLNAVFRLCGETNIGSGIEAVITGLARNHVICA